MSKTIAEGKEDLERAFNLMNEELLKAEYKARVDYYGKYMDEIMEEVAKETKSYKELEEENKKLKEENEKLHDEFMLKLAEAFLLPPTSNQMAVYKQWNFSEWYDEIKNQMRKEIKEGK